MAVWRVGSNERWKALVVVDIAVHHDPPDLPTLVPTLRRDEEAALERDGQGPHQERAEGVGFEPTSPLGRRISSPPQERHHDTSSTTNVHKSVFWPVSQGPRFPGGALWSTELRGTTGAQRNS